MQMTDVAQILKDRLPATLLEETPGWLLIDPAKVLDVFRTIKDAAGFEGLHSVTAVDRKDHFEVVYHLYSLQHRTMLTVKTKLSHEDPKVDSLTPLWEAANWLERETYDFFGIRFVGHPDLRRILNPDIWTDFPMRKDFKRDGFILKPVK